MRVSRPLLFFFALFCIFGAAAATAESEKEYSQEELRRMVKVDMTMEEAEKFGDDPESVLEEMHRLSNECGKGDEGGGGGEELWLGDGKRTEFTGDRNVDLDPEGMEELKNNELMRQMNHFFGGIQTYSEEDEENPSHALKRAVGKALSNLDEEERHLFRSMMGATIFAVFMLLVWISGCMCIMCCGYDTVLTAYIPCCRCAVKAFCWPAICCGECIVVRGGGRFMRCARGCGRICKRNWDKRPWRRATAPPETDHVSKTK